MATTTTTTPFQRSSQLQTLRPTATSLTAAITSLDGGERRYWQEKFGLGRQGITAGTSSSSSSSSSAAGAACVAIAAGSSSVVHQVACDPFPGSRALVVACGPRVQLYGTSPQSSLNQRIKALLLQQSSRNQGAIVGGGGGAVLPDRQIPTGGQVALCGQFRVDGQLLAIGTEAGLRVSQVSTRATLSSHPTPLGVRHVAWLRDGQSLLAFCEDAVRLYRLSRTSGPVHTIRGHHGDVIRCGALWQSKSEAVALSGSYDHTIRMWDLTHVKDEVDEGGVGNNDNGNSAASSCLSVMVHGAPVEAILLLDRDDSSTSRAAADGGGSDSRRPWLVSAGGTYLKVWDLRTGACLQTCSTNHNKTITCLLSVPRVALDGDGKVRQSRPRILTGGLDGYLGIHAWDSFAGTITADIYGTRFQEEGITALGGNRNRVAVGTVSGKVLVRERLALPSSRKSAAHQQQPRAGTYSFFTRGASAAAGAGDYVVGSDNAEKKRKLQDHDVALKQFRYGEALDEALVTRQPKIVAAVLEELGRRRGLAVALSNRDEETLEPILAFTVRYISQPRFAALLIGVSHMLIDIYGDVSGQSETIDELFSKLRTQVSTEARVQRKLLRIVGQLDGLLASMADQEDEDDDEESR